MRCGAVCVAVALAAVCGLSGAADAEVQQAGDWWDTGLGVVQRSLQECEAAKDVTTCLKVKAVRAMDRALRTGGISRRPPDIVSDNHRVVDWSSGGRAVCKDIGLSFIMRPQVREVGSTLSLRKTASLAGGETFRAFTNENHVPCRKFSSYSSVSWNRGDFRSFIVIKKI